MNKPLNPEPEEEFHSDPKVKENFSLLEEIGVINHINSLDEEIRNYKTLFKGALDIINRISINEIIDATVWQISDRFMPSLIVFLWKPLQNREDITIKSYKNYEPVDLNLTIDSISVFEPFFKVYPGPVNYDILSYELAGSETIASLDRVKPELVIPILGPSGL